MTNSIKPTVVKTKRDEFAEDSIKYLEKALVIAKENPQESVAIFMIGRDGNFNSLYSTLDKFELIGQIEFLKWALCNGD